MSTPFAVDAFVSTLALVGVVIVVAALLSGVVERTGFPQVAVFLAMGAMLGPHGLGLLNVTLDSPALRVLATLSLVLVLFTDAATLDLVQIRRYKLLSLLALGPGTLITAALVTLAAWQLLSLPLAAAAILGAALASTDPVLLRNLLQRRDIPSAAREALRVESGLNDLVLLPIVVLSLNFLGKANGTADGDLAREGISLFLLGPSAGVAVGLLGIGALDLIRRQIDVRRDYESLYALGLAFTSYAAAEAVHGSGFLAAFAAGLVISALDVELCDCFIEYGQTTAEMALLLTFVLLGASLIWNGLGIVGIATMLFAVVTLLLRPAVYMAVLARVNIPRSARYLIAWFGPRGLSSLLLVLLAVFAGSPGSDVLFAICCLVVLMSLVLHGATPMLLSARDRRASVAVAAMPPAASEPADVTLRSEALLGAEALPVAFQPETPPPEAPPPASAVPPARQVFAVAGPSTSLATESNGRNSVASNDPEVITIAEVQEIQRAGEPVFLVDVRLDKSYNQSDLQAAGALRLEPDHAVSHARELALPQNAWIVLYCT